MYRPRRKHLLGILVATASVSAVVNTFALGSASAYNAEGNYPTASTGLDPCFTQYPNKLFYAIDAYATAWLNAHAGSVAPVQWADQFWATEGLDNAMRLWNDNSVNGGCGTNIRVSESSMGTNGVLAETSEGGANNECDSMAWTTQCLITINGSYTSSFDFTHGAPCCGKYSLFQTVAHEMGHWIGLDHSAVNKSCASDGGSPGLGCGWYSSSNSAVPVMQAVESSYVGSPTCDDINGFLAARYGYYTNVLPNPSFEYSVNCWGHIASSNGFNWAIYSGGAQSYTYWLQTNGNGGSGSSIFQDMWVHGPVETFGHVRLWLRNESGSTDAVTLAVWNLHTDTLIAVANFNVPSNGTWGAYNLANVAVPDKTPVRIQLYNNSTHNLDVDSGWVGS